MSEASLLSRDKDSMWTNNESGSNMFKANRVRFACGGRGGDFMHPICILVSNLSDKEMPSIDFYVQPIKGLSINGHVDPQSEEVGYLCIMINDVSQQRFFDWFYKNVKCDTLANVRKRFNPMRVEMLPNEEIPVGQRFVMWGDSDIPYLQHMTTHQRVEASSKLGLYYAKIGAKITENANLWT